MPMALRSHRAPCILWPPIFYYFFGFDLLLFCPLQAAIQPHWPVASLPLTVPQILQSCSFLETFAWHCSLQKYFSPQLVLCISSFVSFKSLLKCHPLNEAFPKLPHIQPSVRNSFSLALFFFPYITICYRKISFW